jgi:hypothetical protein
MRSSGAWVTVNLGRERRIRARRFDGRSTAVIIVEYDNGNYGYFSDAAVWVYFAQWQQWRVMYSHRGFETIDDVLDDAPEFHRLMIPTPQTVFEEMFEIAKQYEEGKRVPKRQKKRLDSSCTTRGIQTIN